MLDITLEYLGNGSFRTGNSMSFHSVKSASIKPGERLRSKITRRRSVPQNAYFHVMVQDAFQNQRAGPYFETWLHLKYWLLIKAGHCDVYEFAPNAMTPEMAQLLRRAFPRADFSADRETIYMRVARSIKFNGGADHDEMGAIVDKTINVICEHIIPGMDPDELRAEAKRKAS